MKQKRLHTTDDFGVEREIITQKINYKLFEVYDTFFVLLTTVWAEMIAGLQGKPTILAYFSSRVVHNE